MGTFCDDIVDIVDEGLMSEFGLYLTAVLFICSLFTSKHTFVSRFDINGIIVALVDFIRWTKE